MPTRLEDWDQRYRTGQQVFETTAPLVVQFTQDLAPGNALDLASGPGRNAIYLAERGWTVTAVDGSPVAIELLRAKNPAINANVVDLEAGEFLEAGKINFALDSFDLVLSCYYLQRDLIPRMMSALRPGGLLIMIVHLAGADQPQGTSTRACPNELSSFFTGWHILHFREGEPGESSHRHAVAELVAQKPA